AGMASGTCRSTAACSAGSQASRSVPSNGGGWLALRAMSISDPDRRRPIGQATSVYRRDWKHSDHALIPPMTYAVDADIRVAATLDAGFYRDEAAYAATRERVFART